jgi:hypothetical protein
MKNARKHTKRNTRKNTKRNGINKRFNTKKRMDGGLYIEEHEVYCYLKLKNEAKIGTISNVRSFNILAIDQDFLSKNHDKFFLVIHKNDNFTYELGFQFTIQNKFYGISKYEDIDSIISSINSILQKGVQLKLTDANILTKMDDNNNPTLDIYQICKNIFHQCYHKTLFMELEQIKKYLKLDKALKIGINKILFYEYDSVYIISVFFEKNDFLETNILGNSGLLLYASKIGDEYLITDYYNSYNFYIIFHTIIEFILYGVNLNINNKDKQENYTNHEIIETLMTNSIVYSGTTNNSKFKNEYKNIVIRILHQTIKTVLEDALIKYIYNSSNDTATFSHADVHTVNSKVEGVNPLPPLPKNKKVESIKNTENDSSSTFTNKQSIQPSNVRNTAQQQVIDGSKEHTTIPDIMKESQNVSNSILGKDIILLPTDSLSTLSNKSFQSRNVEDVNVDKQNFDCSGNTGALITTEFSKKIESFKERLAPTQRDDKENQRTRLFNNNVINRIDTNNQKKIDILDDIKNYINNKNIDCDDLKRFYSNLDDKIIKDYNKLRNYSNKIKDYTKKNSETKKQNETKKRAWWGWGKS